MNRALRSLGLKKILTFLLLAFLVGPVAAQEYPENSSGATSWVGRYGNTWLLVVSTVGESRSSNQGPVVEAVVDEILDYTTEYDSGRGSYPRSFLEKVGNSEVPGGTISVGDRLVTQWPQETIVSAPKNCQKCQETVDWNWPDFPSVYGLHFPGYCGFCGDEWDYEYQDGGDNWEAGKDRENHWADCDRKRIGELQKYCTKCGSELPPSHQTVTPPAGKWIIGGTLTSSAPGQNKSFELTDKLYLHHSPAKAKDVVNTLGSWESEPDSSDEWDSD